jgi:hypothetical protein
MSEFAVVAVPLNRPAVIDRLTARSATPTDSQLTVVGLRPAEAAEIAWGQRLLSLPQVTANDYLAIDNPVNNLKQVYSDRLVPVELLNDPSFVTRNLGGWVPFYFGVIDLSFLEQHPTDPVSKWLTVLERYGQEIRMSGADPSLVEDRFPQEMEIELQEAAVTIQQLHRVRQTYAGNRSAYVERLYLALREGGQAGLPVPTPLLVDELIGQLVRLERTRRQALADHDTARADEIAATQTLWKEKFKLKFILKGEYIVGRHRASIVLIAPELGVVIKQPAPEPLHEIALNAHTFNGQPENWPYTTGDGSLVTPRGRLRLILEEGLVPKLSRALKHKIELFCSTGLTVEPFVEGETIQELVWRDPRHLTPQLYEEFIFTQQVCEMVGGENGDWHSANFVVRNQDQGIVHIDWGAARPLRDDEQTPQGRLARLNQVQNIAFSFHKPELAAVVKQFHLDLMADEARLSRIRERARIAVGG